MSEELEDKIKKQMKEFTCDALEEKNEYLGKRLERLEGLETISIKKELNAVIEYGLNSEEQLSFKAKRIGINEAIDENITDMWINEQALKRKRCGL